LISGSLTRLPPPIPSPGRAAAPYPRLDRRERLVERPHTVLEVAADGTGPDRAAHGRRRIAVAGFEIGADGQVDGRGDARDRVDHQLERDLLTVLVAVRGRDAWLAVASAVQPGRPATTRALATSQTLTRTTGSGASCRRRNSAARSAAVIPRA